VYYEPKLAQVNAAEVGFSNRPVRPVAGCCVDGRCAFVPFMDKETGVPATCLAQGIVRGGKKCASDALACARGFNEQEE
jgi:hypothetical protein